MIIVTNKLIAQNDSLVYVYSNGICYHAKIIDYLGKKTSVKPIESKGEKDFFTIKNEQIFSIRSTSDTLIAERLRFFILDNTLADRIIVKGRVLGYNSNFFLMQYKYEGNVLCVSKHKSEIVQKDLK